MEGAVWERKNDIAQTHTSTQPLKLPQEEKEQSITKEVIKWDGGVRGAKAGVKN